MAPRLSSGATAILLVGLVLVTIRQIFGAHGSPPVLGSVHILVLLAILAACRLLSSEALLVTALGGAFVAMSLSFHAFSGSQGLCAPCGLTGVLSLVAMLVVNALVVISVLSRGTGPARLPVIGLLALVPLAQCVLQLIEPKLCPACITTGVASIAAVGAFFEPVAGRRRPRLVAGLLCCSLPIALLLVFVGPSTFKKTPLKDVTGMSLGQLALAFRKGEPPVILLALPGCGWCSKSRALLEESHVPFRQVDIRHAGLNPDFIDIGFAPQLLVVRNGKVIHHIPGYQAEA